MDKKKICPRWVEHELVCSRNTPLQILFLGMHFGRTHLYMTRQHHDRLGDRQAVALRLISWRILEQMSFRSFWNRRLRPDLALGAPRPLQSNLVHSKRISVARKTFSALPPGLELSLNEFSLNRNLTGNVGRAPTSWMGGLDTARVTSFKEEPRFVEPPAVKMKLPSIKQPSVKEKLSSPRSRLLSRCPSRRICCASRRNLLMRKNYSFSANMLPLPRIHSKMIHKNTLAGSDALLAAFRQSHNCGRILLRLRRVARRNEANSRRPALAVVNNLSVRDGRRLTSDSLTSDSLPSLIRRSRSPRERRLWS